MGASACGPRPEPVSSVQVAIIVVIAMLIVYYLIEFLARRSGRDGFASKRAHEVHDRAHEVFAEGGGDAPYSNYKENVPDADPVQYSDVRRLFKEGNMTPDSVEGVL